MAEEPPAVEVPRAEEEHEHRDGERYGGLARALAEDGGHDPPGLSARHPGERENEHRQNQDRRVDEEAERVLEVQRQEARDDGDQKRVEEQQVRLLPGPDVVQEVYLTQRGEEEPVLEQVVDARARGVMDEQREHGDHRAVPQDPVEEMAAEPEEQWREESQDHQGHEPHQARRVGDVHEREVREHDRHEERPERGVHLEPRAPAAAGSRGIEGDTGGGPGASPGSISAAARNRRSSTNGLLSLPNVSDRP